MTGRPRLAQSRLAWALFALTVLLAVTQVVILARARTPLLSGEFSDDGFPLVTVAAVLASAVGALIVTRHPGHRIGWLFLLGQVGTMLGLTAQAYGFNALTDDVGPRSVAHLAVWFSILTGGAFALALFALLLLLAPDGHLLSPRWRWAVYLTVGSLVLHDATVLTISPGDVDAEAEFPGAPTYVTVLSLAAGIGLSIGLVAGAVSLVLRFRRARGRERFQLRWIAGAAAALAASIPVGVVLDLLLGAPVWVGSLPLMCAYLAVPVCTGVAILRFRLYEIDVLLNRSIVLALLTGFVTVGYVAAVVVAGEVGDRSWHPSPWASLLLSVAVALAFQPLRRRVSQLADRVVYGAQALPYEALASFNEELRHSAADEELLPRTAEAVGRTVGASGVRLWRERAGSEPVQARWGDRVDRAAADGSPAGHAIVLPVRDRHGPLGGLELNLGPGRGLRRFEERLLADVVAQLAAAFRAVRMQEELSTKVDLLARRGEELRSSKERLQSAQSAERRRFEAAIADRVLPPVASLPRDLAALTTAADEGWPGAAVDGLIGRAGAALDSLREVTRGVFPAQLSRRGLVPALRAHLDRAEAGHTLRVAEETAAARFPAAIESVAYFCAVEALRGLDGDADLSLVADPDRLVLTLSGRAGPTLEAATYHLRDRTEAVAGSIGLERRGAEVKVVVELPLVAAGPLPDGHEPVAVEG